VLPYVEVEGESALICCSPPSEIDLLAREESLLFVMVVPASPEVFSQNQSGEDSERIYFLLMKIRC
jgi:hypothetical protein